MKYFVSTIIFFVSVILIFGFYFAGTPQTARKQRFDEMREQNIEQIEWIVQDYYDMNNKLPDSMEELRNSNTIERVSVDPETQEPYEYNVLDEDSFLLCTTFYFESSKLSRTKMELLSTISSLEHGAGYHCFEKNIMRNVRVAI
jgi:hypothetical protein